MASALWTTCACVRVADGPPAKLLDGFRSFQTPDEARLLILPSSQWAVIDSAKRQGSTGAPRFEKQTVRLAPYSSFGCTGYLLLQFLNGRLMETVFYPDDLRLYREALVREGFDLGPDAGASAPVLVSPSTPRSNVRVFAARDFQDRAYISWLDTRLEREYLDLVRAHS